MGSTRTPGNYYLGPSHNVLITRNDTGATVLLDGPRDRFSSEHSDELVKDNTIDNGGRITGTVVPGGITGMIEVEKNADDFTNLIATTEQGYFALQPRVTYTIVETITSPKDGSTITNVFNAVNLHGLKRGDWERAGIVKVSVNFFATEVLPQN